MPKTLITSNEDKGKESNEDKGKEHGSNCPHPLTQNKNNNKQTKVEIIVKRKEREGRKHEKKTLQSRNDYLMSCYMYLVCVHFHPR